MRKLLVLAVWAMLVLVGYGAAHGVPILQLYIEGAHYDPDTESWVVAPPGSSGGGGFNLWAIGNVSGPGGAGTISHVRLSASYSADSDVTIHLTPTTASQTELDELQAILNENGQEGEVRDLHEPDFEPFSSYDYEEGSDFWKNTDSIPDEWAKQGIPTSNQWWGDDSGEGGDVVKDGSWPLLSSGQELPRHDTFGDGSWWQEFYLGNFTRYDEPIADFIPPEDYTGTYDITSLEEVYATGGQINVYEVTVTGASVVHFDLYNHVGADDRAKAKFAPFSHDAQIAPELGSFAIWSVLGALGMTIGWWRRRRTAT